MVAPCRSLSVSEADSIRLALWPSTVDSTPGQVVTIGASTGATAPQTLRGEALVRGIGAPGVKSARLLSVSAQPASLRSSASTFEPASAGVVSKPVAVPKPSRSTTFGVAGEAPTRLTVLLTSAILPVVADKFSLPLRGATRGVGSSGTAAVPACCSIRTYWPGSTTIGGSGAMLVQVELLVAAAYCRLQPCRLTATLPRLKIST